MSKSSNVKVAIVGIGQRAGAFLNFCRKTPQVEPIALCDISPSRLEFFARQYGYESTPKYTELDELFAHHHPDGLIITVPDFMHCTTALTAFKNHCSVMLEKPMAPTAEDSRKILRAWQQSGEVLQLGFVLRCHPFYRKLKALLEQGAIGELTNIEASETLNVMHGASYMRRWHRLSRNSGGFLLAKCSHDLDILSYLTGTRPLRVASFGSLGFFLPEKQRYTHCSKCPDKSCRFRFKGEMVAMTPEEKLSPSTRNFDLCVYNNDKDVVDRQNVILEYPYHVGATFSLNLFAHEGNRRIKLFGTEGMLEGDLNSSEITLTHSADGAVEKFSAPAANNSGHGGSDKLFFDEFIDALRTGAPVAANAYDGLAATVIGNAAEEARLNHRVVEIPPEAYQL